MSTTSPEPTLAGSSAAMGRLGPWFAAIWLFFLLSPLLDGWAQRDQVSGVVGILATLAFAAVYMVVWVRTRADRMRLVAQPPLPQALAYVATLVALGALMVACVGESGLASTVYVGVACVMVLDLRVAVPMVAALIGIVLGLGSVEGWGSQVGTAFGVMAASVAVFGLRTVLSRNIELVRAHQENARLAVDNERSRFARDLHDILGHSLTVITVKAELAQRLLDVDVERTRAELADLERLSRDALTDVRRAVQGYRELTLPGELTRARAALAAAEIDAELPNSADEVPTELRELFAWTVREGVTNVIRHSRARTCEVRLTPTSAEVVDDGTGPGGGTATAGSGLAGLRERAAAAGATVVTRELSPGYSLRVVRP
ncbi:sensor histidine kinase [Nocardioides ungokensis]|uniref:sensor histidine kinase n=1 Tax=Nocardioides ungokensis TaxID=1643322 RepID=UPI001C610672|nr:histidine kinase [Nocardioides ungokensis]